MNQYFLVYDEWNSSRVREVFFQNGMALVKTEGKIKVLRKIGYEELDVEAEVPVDKKSIYKIVGEVALVNTL